jgi:hypothetical protein
MTARADAEGRATYLESSAKSNLGYYVKYGFEQKCDIQLERGEQPVKLHIMVREPQSLGEGSNGKAQETAKIRTL